MNAVIFKELPATFPDKDEYKKQSIIGSLIFHAVLITVLILVPFLMLPELKKSELLTMLVPLPPPPALLPAPVFKGITARPSMPKAVANRSAEDVVIMPTVIPTEIVRVVDPPAATDIGVSGVIGGVPGGLPGAMPGGVLGIFLRRNTDEDAAVSAPPPPPPPPEPVIAPRKPVRVGGAVREPRLISLIPPIYPRLASKARITGSVVLEATLTADGTVDEIQVISGHPLLRQAAIDCVKQWRYEPTYLNGTPVPVVFTAVVNFRQES